MDFQDWISLYESKKAAPKKKKRAKKPNPALDGFIKEIELLKKDMESLDKKRKEEKPKKEKEGPIDQDLLHAGKIAYSNLKISSKFYSSRPKVGSRRVSRSEAMQIAQKIGVVFDGRITPEIFRRALEVEINGNEETDSAPETGNPTGRLPYGGSLPDPSQEQGSEHPGWSPDRFGG